MKRFLYNLLLFAGVAHLASCSVPDTPVVPDEPTHENNEFLFENILAQDTQLRVDITPEDKDMEYIVFLSEKKHFLMNNIDTRDELLEDDYIYFTELAEQYNMPMRDFLEAVGWLVKGEVKNYGAINLYPDTEYVVYCYGVNFDGEYYEATTPVNYVVIKTSTPELIDVKFDVETKVEGNRVSINVDPNGYNNLYYSYIVPETDSYYLPEGAPFNADYLAHYRNMALDTFNELINNQGIPAKQFCHSGTATRNERLNPNANYMVVCFAVSDEQTPILCSEPSVAYFTTAESNKSDLTIKIEVTDITQYNAMLTVTPSKKGEEYATEGSEQRIGVCSSLTAKHTTM